MKEDALWQKFISGDKKALSYIFKMHYKELYNYGLKLSNDADFTMDSMQDLFLKLWKNRAHLGNISEIKPYLFKALRNKIVDNFKVLPKYDPVNEDDVQEMNVEYSYEDLLISKQLTKEKREKLIKALNQLSPKQREAVYLRFFEELDFATIAVIMKTNVQSVRNTLHRAMTSLRNMYLT